MEILILLAGIEVGPFSEEQVRQQLADGVVSPSDWAKIAGSKKWETIERVLATPPKAIPAPDPSISSEDAPKTPGVSLRTNKGVPPALKPPPQPPEPTPS